MTAASAPAYNASGGNLSDGQRSLVGRSRSHRHAGATRRFAALDRRRYLVAVDDTGRHVRIGVCVVSARRLHGVDHFVVPEQRVGDVRTGGPSALLHGGPGQDRAGPARGRHRGQCRALPQLEAELLPGCMPIAVQVRRQHRILAWRSEVPGIVEPTVTRPLSGPGSISHRCRNSPPAFAGLLWSSRWRRQFEIPSDR